MAAGGKPKWSENQRLVAEPSARPMPAPMAKPPPVCSSLFSGAASFVFFRRPLLPLRSPKFTTEGKQRNNTYEHGQPGRSTTRDENRASAVGVAVVVKKQNFNRFRKIETNTT